jgi:hypothetical protein
MEFVTVSRMSPFRPLALRLLSPDSFLRKLHMIQEDSVFSTRDKV